MSLEMALKKAVRRHGRTWVSQRHTPVWMRGRWIFADGSSIDTEGHGTEAPANPGELQQLLVDRAGELLRQIDAAISHVKADGGVGPVWQPCFGDRPGGRDEALRRLGELRAAAKALGTELADGLTSALREGQRQTARQAAATEADLRDRQARRQAAERENDAQLHAELDAAHARHTARAREITAGVGI